MQKRPAILLTSVQHTGTWWAIATLRNNPKIGGFAHVHNLDALTSGTMSSNPHNESVRGPGTLLLHDHWGSTDPNWTWATVDEWDVTPSSRRTLAPMRDPLQAMLTRHNRHPEKYPHMDHLRAFLGISQQDFTFFRVSPFSYPAFGLAMQRVGLYDPVWISQIDTAARPNTSGTYTLKKAYLDGDFRTIRRQVPEIVHNLMDHEDILRPFLEELGYEDLMWWS